MKAVGGLFDQIGMHETLSTAAWRASQGKRSRPEVAEWLADAPERIRSIADRLNCGQYHFSPYRAFAIRDPKSRIIHAPCFEDRVVHHAIIAVTGRIFERGAYHHSYACRRGRGQHLASGHLRRWLQPDSWFLKIDVEKFYDSVEHGQLLQSLARRFRERRLLRLWDNLLSSYATRPGHGIPIGALTSQYLGNFYLDPVDHRIQGRPGKHRHMRYMDDFIVIGDKVDLLGVKASMESALAYRGLKMKQGGTLNRVSLGVPFLGFTLYPDRVRLNSLGRQRLRRKCREMMRTLHRDGRELSQSECAALGSIFAHATFANDVTWRRSLCRRMETLWERQGRATGSPGRLLEQHRRELPLRYPQQEPSWQSQQEQRLPPLLVLRHGEAVPSPDVAFSSAPANTCGDQSSGKRPSIADIPTRMGSEKGVDG
ncbi:MAG: reverse transcriptase domain-containing protein [Verrucomicrobiota bacterium]